MDFLSRTTPITLRKARGLVALSCGRRFHDAQGAARVDHPAVAEARSFQASFSLHRTTSPVPQMSMPLE